MLASARRLLTRDTTWFEMANATLLFVWFVVLIFPAQTFASSHAYWTMSAWASEPSWAVLALVFAAFGFLGLRDHLSCPRSIGLMGGVFFWATVGGSISMSSPVSTGGWVYLAFANLCAAAYIARRR